jgi:acyl dehydratase
MSYAYILDMIITEFGHRWLNGGELQVAFLHYVLPGDTITPEGMVISKETDNSSTRITLEVWCHNQRNEKVAAGSATGVIRDGD